jgi:hypothetical protein
VQPGFTGDQIPEAIHTIQGFLQANRLDDKLEYLRRHSFLLTDEALHMFDVVREGAAEEGDKDTEEAVASHRMIVEEVRELGFSEAAKRLHSLVLLQTMKDFMAGYSWMDSYVFLQKHPELLSEDALATVIALGMRAHEEGDAQAEKVAAAHYNLLRRIPEVGAEAAFIEIGGNDFLASLQRSRAR